MLAYNAHTSDEVVIILNKVDVNRVSVLFSEHFNRGLIGQPAYLRLHQVHIRNHPVNEILYSLRSPNSTLIFPQTVINPSVDVWPRNPAQVQENYLQLNSGNCLIVPAKGDIDHNVANTRDTYINFNQPILFKLASNMAALCDIEIVGLTESLSKAAGQTNGTNPENVAGSTFKMVLYFSLS